MRIGNAVSAAIAACLLSAMALASAQTSGPYVTPRPGWLYIVDSNRYADDGRLLIVDPDAGRVVWSRPTGHLPDMALSADGTQLYLVSSDPANDLQGKLEVIDTATGQTLREVPDPDRMVSTGNFYISRMSLSRDGRWLYQIKMDNTPGNVSYYVDTFDTEQSALLKTKAPAPLCAWPTLLSAAESTQLILLCNETFDVRVVNPASASGAAQAQRLPLGPATSSATMPARTPALALIKAKGVNVITGDGRFIQTDARAQSIVQSDVLDRTGRGLATPDQQAAAGQASSTPPPNTNDWLAGRWIKQQAPVLSPDGAQLYLGVSSIGELRRGRQFLEQIVVLDTQTLTRRRSINARHEFTSLTLSRDGSRLYVIDGETATLRVLDAATGQELKAFKVGTTPVFAVVAP
jgi:DNA-binding beta-propeller fold protein YncE